MGALTWGGGAWQVGEGSWTRGEGAGAWTSGGEGAGAWASGGEGAGASASAEVTRTAGASAGAMAAALAGALALALALDLGADDEKETDEADDEDIEGDVLDLVRDWVVMVGRSLDLDANLEDLRESEEDTNPKSERSRDFPDALGFRRDLRDVEELWTDFDDIGRIWKGNFLGGLKIAIVMQMR